MSHGVSEVLDHLTGLPPFPKVTTKLLTMLNDDSISADDLSHVISSDPSLVLKVLHLANSPFYMLSKSIDNVKEAVLVLGINTIKSITTAASIQKGITSVKPRIDAFDMLGFWRHSYATAIAANKLGYMYDRKLADTLYVVGLIHDIGKVIIACYWPEVWKAIIKTLESSQETYVEVELRLFGQSHSQIGATLCNNWHFPDQIVELVACHHDVHDQAPSQALELLMRAHQLAGWYGFSFPTSKSLVHDLSDASQEMQKIGATLSADVEYQLRVLDN
jgi:HD-like signal output (HDOD) protein